MTIKKAYEILGCSVDDNKNEIKKKYKKLLHKVHPDSNQGKEKYRYSVQEIMEAYKYLTDENLTKKVEQNIHSKSQKPPVKNWDASINSRAYTERKVFQNVEDYDGEIIGTIEIASGKYMWKPEEDFVLFLKSIYECSKDLLASHKEEDKLRIQPQLAFLLASQFIDGMEFLNSFSKKEEEDIFYINSMLELKTSETANVRVGMSVYPKKLKDHKLYVQNQKGEELGYLSFKDDRLYYCVIPLFEEKRAQVKMKISSNQDRLNTRNINKYKNLDLWIKLINVDTNEIMNDLNSQIDELLKNFK